MTSAPHATGLEKLKSLLALALVGLSCSGVVAEFETAARPPAMLVIDHRLNATDSSGQLYPGYLEGEVILESPEERVDHIDLTLMTFKPIGSSFWIDRYVKLRMTVPGRFRVQHLPEGEWWVTAEAIRGPEVSWARSEELILDQETRTQTVVLRPVTYAIEASVMGVPPELQSQAQIGAKVYWSDEVAATTLDQGFNSIADDEPSEHLGTMKYRFFGSTGPTPEGLTFDPALGRTEQFAEFGDFEQIKQPDQTGQVSYWAPGPSTATIRLLAVPAGWDELTQEVRIDPDRPRVHVEFDVSKKTSRVTPPPD